MGMNEISPKEKGLRSILKKMADPGILFYLLPWLMVLLTAGTVAQKDLGIYQSQQIFFSSWIIWLGPLPLPGAYPTLGLLTACLTAKFILYSPWRWDRAGTIITHFGVLVLLGGGIITAATQKEGYLSIREGQRGNIVSDYHNRILSIKKDGQHLASIPFDDLVAGQNISADLPFTMTTLQSCANCQPAPVNNPKNRHGLAAQMAISPALSNKENETNLSGVTLALKGLPDEQDGIYVTMEEIPHVISVSINDANYHIAMGREERGLPFSIELKDFKQDFYPGMMMARGFSSDVIVHDGDIEWPANISMNEPLRYKGYTLYQASFAEKPDGQYSVFSVVQNKGRAFPYIASFLIFAGLLLHCLLRIRISRKDRA
jgi:hypothetical protein